MFMDGNTANVPSKWIGALFHSLQELIEDKKTVYFVCYWNSEFRKVNSFKYNVRSSIRD